MKRLLTAAICASCLLVAMPAGAQEPARVPAGVSVAGVDVSGLTWSESEARLDQQLEPSLARPVAVIVGAKTFTIDAAQAGFSLNLGETTSRAMASAPGTPVAPVVRISQTSLERAVAKIADSVNGAPRDAKIRIGLKKIKVTKARAGRRISTSTVIAAATRAFSDPAAPRLVAPKVLPARPKVTEADLRRQYRTVLTASKREFKVRLFKNFKVVKTYGVATGQPAYPTPSGRFTIRDKAVNPVWSVPDSPWAGELQGTKVAGGTAENPLKARWMGIGDGVGFHGTGQEYTIGSRASHGCLRMRVKDIISLYPRVPVGTTVLIK